MPDRFTLEGPGNLERNFRNHMARWDEATHLRDAGDMPENLDPMHCSARQRIVEWSDSVQELAEALKRHEKTCSQCSAVRCSARSEGSRGSKERKAA